MNAQQQVTYDAHAQYGWEYDHEAGGVVYIRHSLHGTKASILDNGAVTVLPGWTRPSFEKPEKKTS